MTTEKSKKSFRILWVLSLSLVALVLFKKTSEYALDEHWPSLMQFDGLERHWSLAKQRVSAPRFPSQTPQIFEPEFLRAAHFWRDEPFQRELVSFVESYPGPVLLNLDPQALLESVILRRLFELEHVLRPIEISSIHPIAGLELRDALRPIALQQTQSLSPQLGVQARLSPYGPSYYSSGQALQGRFGVINYSVDQASARTHFIGSFPLSFSAFDFELPGMLLSALRATGHCEAWGSRSTKFNFVECLDGAKPNLSGRRFLNPLPLRFYQKPFPKKRSFQELQASDQLLVVHMVDASSEFPNPFGERFTWSDLFVTAFLNIQADHTPQYNFWSVGAESLLLLFFAILILLLSLYLKSSLCIALSLLVLGLFLMSDALLYLVLGYFTQPIESFFTLILVGGVGVSSRLTKESSERKILEKAFSGYVSEDRLKRLISGKEKLQLQGRIRQLSYLMIDIEGFSQISKTLSPQALFDFMQRFFAIVDAGIFEFGGIIDKKTGDGLLAFFGDEEDIDKPEESAVAAIRAGLSIQERLWQSELNVGLRVGINSGPAAIGNAGSKRHFNYTVLGEAVNFTQRLEAACPAGKVLVGQTTYELTKRNFNFRAIEIQVKKESEIQKAYLVESSL